MRFPPQFPICFRASAGEATLICRKAQRRRTILRSFPAMGLGMTGKTAIVQSLGETAVLLPALLSQALSANERAKLRMTVLQDALAYARNPASVRNALIGQH